MKPPPTLVDIQRARDQLRELHEQEVNGPLTHDELDEAEAYFTEPAVLIGPRVIVYTWTMLKIIKAARTTLTAGRRKPCKSNGPGR